MEKGVSGQQHSDAWHYYKTLFELYGFSLLIYIYIYIGVFGLTCTYFD
jgi:hypothetical protein